MNLRMDPMRNQGYSVRAAPLVIRQGNLAALLLPPERDKRVSLQVRHMQVSSDTLTKSVRDALDARLKVGESMTRELQLPFPLQFHMFSNDSARPTVTAVFCAGGTGTF